MEMFYSLVSLVFHCIESRMSCYVSIKAYSTVQEFFNVICQGFMGMSAQSLHRESTDSTLWYSQSMYAHIDNMCAYTLESRVPTQIVYLPKYVCTQILYCERSNTCTK